MDLRPNPQLAHRPFGPERIVPLSGDPTIPHLPNALLDAMDDESSKDRAGPFEGQMREGQLAEGQMREDEAPVDLVTKETSDAVTMAGDYVLAERIGVGGFGDVFRAEHSVMGKAAAIKILSHKYSHDPEMTARFIREARAACSVDAPQVVDVFEFGRLDDNRLFYAMELLDGEPLNERLDRAGALAPLVCIRILRQVAQGIDAAHAADVVHRDIKPGNIFIESPHDRARLLDFGIALLDTEATGERLTKTGTTVGTPTYMAPEQALGRTVDHRADLYALGIVAFELLTGAPPFVGASFHEIQAAHIHQRFPSVRAVAKTLQPDADTVLAWICAKDPDARPRCAKDAIDELERALMGQRLVLTPQKNAALRLIPKTPLGRTLVALGGVVAIAGFVLPFIVPSASDGGETLVPSRPEVQARVSAPARVTSSPTPAVSKIDLEVVLSPSTAEVVDESGQPLHLVAGHASIPIGDDRRTFSVRAPGHVAQIFSIAPNQSQRIEVRLVENAPSPSVSSKTPSFVPPSKSPNTTAPRRGPNDIEPW